MAREKSDKPAEAAPADFEGAMTELERIVEELEGNQLSLDQSLAHYERGMALAAQLTKTLDQAEKRIEKLVEGENAEPRTEPMEASAPAPPAEESAPRLSPPVSGSPSDGELPF